MTKIYKKATLMIYVHDVSVNIINALSSIAATKSC